MQLPYRRWEKKNIARDTEEKICMECPSDFVQIILDYLSRCWFAVVQERRKKPS